MPPLRRDARDSGNRVEPGAAPMTIPMFMKRNYCYRRCLASTAVVRLHPLVVIAR
jgi:hypothetical protein